MREPTHSRAKNLYELLEVSPSASQSVIQAAYHVLARTWHPDVNPAPEAALRIRDLNAAYQVLSNPQRRASYDLQRLRWNRRDRAAHTPAGQPVNGVARVRTPDRVAGGRLNAGPNPASASRLPAYSAQAILAMATIAILVAAVLMLLWAGMALPDEMLLNSGPFIEIVGT